jgi:hypothetical protein
MTSEACVEEESGFTVIRAAEIPLEEAPRRWLIEGLWGAASVGIVGGTPKSLKTWTSLEMAVSVATGTACLDRYPVLERGRALLYLAEDSLPMIRERIAALANHRALTIDALDIYVITTPAMRLDMAKDQVRLLKTAQGLRPRILVLDPLIRLHRLNENAANEVSALLSYLRDLQRELDLAVVLVHHTRKNTSPGDQGGQGLRGSGDFHAWSDSSLYLRRSHGELILSAEHRAAPSPEPIAIRLVTDDPAHPYMVADEPSPAAREEATLSLESRLLETLSAETGITRADLRERLRVKNERLGLALGQLELQGKIARDTDGWRLNGHTAPVVPRSPPGTQGERNADK